MLKKGASFKWSSVEKKDFQCIKNDLLNSKMLINYEGEDSLITEVNASLVGISCVLTQNVDSQEKPVCFAIKKIIPR